MTDLSSQSGDRESKVFLQEAINRQVAACSNRASLPPLDSVSWSSAFSIAQGFGEPSRELRGHDLNPTKVKVEASEGRRPKTEMEGRGFPAESSGDHLNEGILVLKSVSNMAEEQPDTTMEPVPSMYCLSDGNILVPMFCPELVAEHAGKHLESKMNDSKGYTLQQSDISQSSLMAHFQHQQQQHHEYLSSWAESSSHVGSSYDTYGSEYASEADYQAIQPHHFQQQQRQQQQQQQQQQQPHQSHLHQHPEVTSNPPKKKRRRIITTDQRRAANIRERRRMSHLNEAFDGLRKRVPTFAYEKKLSRIETLKLAVTYIKFMSGLLETLDSSGDSRRSGMGFHGDQKLVQSVHSGPLFHSSLPNLSARHHVHLSISTNCSSLATDDDESLDEEEGGDVVGDLQGKRCMEMPIKGCKDLEFKK